MKTQPMRYLVKYGLEGAYNMSTHFEEWQKEWTRDVTRFGIISSKYKEIHDDEIDKDFKIRQEVSVEFETPFYIYGLQLDANTNWFKTSEYWLIREKDKWGHPISGYPKIWEENGWYSDREFKVEKIKKNIILLAILVFEDNSAEVLKTFVMEGGTSRKKIRLLNKAKKVKKITIKNISTDIIFYGVEGPTDFYKKESNEYIRVGWFFCKTYAEPAFSIEEIKIYENPQIDSGMRIKGDGIIYKPAESLFPSPLRIYNGRIRNIMLVPKGCDYASVFKIKTEEGLQAITTLIN